MRTKNDINRLTIAAEQGMASAQATLGEMYHEGQDVPQNYNTAFKWIKLAAEQGHVDSQVNLGWMYEQGDGVPQNYKATIKWYKLAAEREHKGAQWHLGRMYYEGTVVPQNYNTAFKWFKPLAEQGDKSAQAYLERIGEFTQSDVEGDHNKNDSARPTEPEPVHTDGKIRNGYPAAASFTDRMIGASKLDVNTYEEVEADTTALGQAMGVVMLSSVATGIGFASQQSAPGSLITAAVLTALFGWLFWAWLAYFIGTHILPSPQTNADWGQLLRTTGFAAAPGVLRIFAIVPALQMPVLFITSIWMLATFIVAVRQALDYPSTLRAVGVCVIGWLPFTVLILVLHGLFR